MFVTLFVIAIPAEGFGPLRDGFSFLIETKGLFTGILILLFPGVLAFCMTSAEFALLKRTSVVTLSVCGIFKEVLTISAASIVFGDRLTPINISGLCVTLAAIIFYNYIRIKKMRRQEVKKAQDSVEQEHAPMLAEPASAVNVDQGVLVDGVNAVRRTSTGDPMMNGSTKKDTLD